MTQMDACICAKMSSGKLASKKRGTLSGLGDFLCEERTSSRSLGTIGGNTPPPLRVQRTFHIRTVFFGDLINAVLN